MQLIKKNWYKFSFFISKNILFQNIDGKSSMQSAGNIGTQIAVLQKFGDKYAKRIEKEKKKLDDLNSKIKDV